MGSISNLEITMADTIKKTNLEKIALKMTSSLNLQEVLISITKGLVDEIDAAFARIRLYGAGGTFVKHVIWPIFARTVITAFISRPVHAYTPV